MASWFGARKKLEETAADEALIRVCVVTRDAALMEEVHKDLLVGFLTRAAYEFESGHPDFQQRCDVLLLDLRAAGVQGDPRDSLSFIDEIRKSVSHPPIVALCDGDAAEFVREVMQRGAYEKLAAPVNMPQLRLALQRAYEFRSAEMKLESFLSEESATRERARKAQSRNARPSTRAAVGAARPMRQRTGPSRLAVGFVLGCVLFFAGVVAVRTILGNMGDALASAGGLAADSAAPGLSSNPVDSASQLREFAGHRNWPLSASADFKSGEFDSVLTPRHFRSEAELPPAVRLHTSLPGYDPAVVIERVTPRYSTEARSLHLQGTVKVRAVIGKDGVPRMLARVSGDATLARIAMDAIALWRYEPATLDGESVESETVIPIDFRLPD
jgi:TonB family protein